VAILLGDSAEPEVAYAIHPRAIEMRRKILVDALKLLPAHDAIDGLRSRITTKTSVDARLLAIQVLSEIGGVPAFDGAIGIAGAFDPIQWQRTFVQVAIENACVELVGRNPRIARRLASSMQDSPPGLAQIEARALTRARAATALPALLASLGRDSALDLCILQQLEKIGDRCDPLAAPDALKRLHAMLESPDHDVQRAALVAAARMGDTESVPLMLSRLTSADTLTQTSARWSLETLSGEKRGLDPAAWIEWWSHEKTWAEEELPNLSYELQIRDAEKVKLSIDAGLTHRAHRHAVASAIKPMLEAQDPAAQRLACGVLAQIGSPRALPWLIEKLESESEDVRNAAWNGLRTITKLDVPADAAAWRLALAP
jgi:HEAT repeat protein